MESNRGFHSLQLTNFLSFGAEGVHVTLQPLNVLIGQNASGKTNFLQAIELLRSLPGGAPPLGFGGVSYVPQWTLGSVTDLLHRGPIELPTAQIAAEIHTQPIADFLRHRLTFTSINQRLQVLEEDIEPAPGTKGDSLPNFYYRFAHNEAAVVMRQAVQKPLSSQQTLKYSWVERRETGSIRPDQSILTQRNDPNGLPALSALVETYRAIKIFRDFEMHGQNSLRVGQRPDLPDDFLEESGRNLSLILNDFQYQGIMGKIVASLKDVYDEVEDVTVKVSGGTVQTFIRERGLRDPIPAGRLSDGTLRYLCLLAILHHPKPPPLVCLEEPEVGLHPDVIARLADLLIEASQRMQLIVTTHSDLLVTALGQHPEAILVCERGEQGTRIERLEADRMEKWLQEYSLGELWRSGEIGGVRF
jgi:predicted ATPase